MRTLLCCIALATLSSAASIDSEVKAALGRQEAAWNRGDIRTFMQEYVASPDLTFVGKQVSRGWQATLDRYLQTYPTPAAMGRLTFSEIEVHALGRDHAWVLGRFALARTAEGGGNASGRYTLIFQRTKQGWKVAVDHTSSD